MPLSNIFDIAGSAMSAQTLRLNTVASNLANADSVASTPEQAYRARNPVFSAMMQGMGRNAESVGVRVQGVTESQAPINKQYAPGNPLADATGYIYTTNVNPVEEMTNMISASRSYQNNVEVLNTSKQLVLSTLKLGQ
jgi:flagellar basal-body rod protein FlgC